MKTPGEYLCDLRVGTDVLDRTQKALGIKGKFDILDEIKNGSVFQSKVTINWVNTDKSQKISATYKTKNKMTEYITELQQRGLRRQSNKRWIY